jgi:hypothetical protein
MHYARVVDEAILEHLYVPASTPQVSRKCGPSVEKSCVRRKCGASIENACVRRKCGPSIEMHARAASVQNIRVGRCLENHQTYSCAAGAVMVFMMRVTAVWAMTRPLSEAP